MSVMTGAMVVGVMTLMMTRSLRLLLSSLSWTAAVDENLRHWMALTIGASSALLFGFNRGVWLWASVSEMRVLNVFSFVLIACTFFVWMLQPQRRFYLYATLLLLGLSLANHQTVAIMVIPLGVGAVAVGIDRFLQARSGRSVSEGGSFPTSLLMTCMSDGWELAAAGALSGAVLLAVLAWLLPAGASSGSGSFSSSVAQACWGSAILAVAAVVISLVGKITGWWAVRRTAAAAGLFLLGVSFYLYMPLAASTNPPMNWGYAATKEGFLHAISRGQYEKLNTAHLFSEEFLLKIWVFIRGLLSQYSLALNLVALVALAVLVVFWFQWKRSGRSWMVFVTAAYLATSLGLLTIINPKLDRQEQEITIKFFAPAHGFLAMLIGYGFAFLLSAALWRWPRLPAGVVRVACVALLALPLVTFSRNWSLCALRGNDFGYKFGYLMFCPGGGYPPMEKDAVLYGGTDPGRFVPTYMIFCESRVAPKNRFFDKTFDRSDVYIITQNALADNTYMSYIRDHYDFSRPKNDKPLQRLLGRDRTYPVEPIYIPSPSDLNQAFQQYVEDVQLGRIPPSADLKFDNGRVMVQGVQGVMMINGILAKWIFDRNKDKHAFYVEESYVIPWMYPYLRPSGIIMKIEKDPLPSPQEAPAVWQDIVARDRAYWDKLTIEFLARPDFGRNNDARKSFSKLRSAIAGLYVSRGLTVEAEYAFRQSLRLCPESPEANFRLADLYMQFHRFADARGLIEDYLKVDEYNSSAKSLLEGIKTAEKDDKRRIELERSMGQGAIDIQSALELASIYQRFSMEGQFMGMIGNIMGSSNIPPIAYLNVAQLCGNVRKWDLVAAALRRYLDADAGNFRAWIDLACAEAGSGRGDEAMAALRRSVELGGELAREIIRQDPRLVPLRTRPEFGALATPAVPLDQPLNSALKPYLRV
jgi:tetratricopeptide (TPR) repeat protein